MKALSGKISVLALLVVVLGAMSWSQVAQQGNQAQPSEPSPRTRPVTTSDRVPPPVAGIEGPVEVEVETPSAVPDPAAVMPIQAIGAAGGLPSVLGPTHLGPIYLRSFGYNFDWFNGSLAAEDGFPGHETLHSFTAQVVLQKLLGRRRIALQYSPQLTILNGHFSTNFSNQNVSFDDQYVISRAWKVGVHDSFSQVGQQSLMGNYVNGDAKSFSSVQNPFLSNMAGFLSNALSATVSNQFSRDTAISISPSFTYGRTGQVANQVAEPQFTSYVYGISTLLSHTLDAKKSLGAYYSFQVVRITPDFSNGNTYYHSFGGSYSQQITPTLKFNGNLGIGVSGLASSPWTVVGEGSLYKTIGWSSIIVTYTRSDAFAGYVTNNTFGDRADVQFSTPAPWVPRLRTALGGGYLRGTGLNDQKIIGKYVTTGFDYSLFSRLVATATYTYKFQQGDGLQLTSGTENMVAVGLRWDLAHRSYPAASRRGR